MKKSIFLIALVLLYGQFVFSGVWTRDNADTISFKGKIESDEFERFTKIMDEKVRILKVDSGGGETSAALKIGFSLRQHNVEIQVNNWCLSSCANYLFLGAIKRVIAKGIVGFHGNVQACFGGDKWAEQANELRKQGVPEEKIQSFHQETLKQIEDEKRFLHLVGVSQELFDVSCRADKGLNDGIEYAFLLPLPKTFEKYGITGVAGVQDQETVKTFPAPLAIK